MSSDSIREIILILVMLILFRYFFNIFILRIVLRFCEKYRNVVKYLIFFVEKYSGLCNRNSMVISVTLRVVRIVIL